MTRKITIVITNLLEFNTETEQWRLHVKTLFENIAFLSLLVKKDPKQNMSSSSEVNRGNFIGIELLSLRATHRETVNSLVLETLLVIRTLVDNKQVQESQKGGGIQVHLESC